MSILERNSLLLTEAVFVPSNVSDMVPHPSTIQFSNVNVLVVVTSMAGVESLSWPRPDKSAYSKVNCPVQLPDVRMWKPLPLMRTREPDVPAIEKDCEPLRTTSFVRFVTVA